MAIPNEQVGGGHRSADARPLVRTARERRRVFRTGSLIDGSCRSSAHKRASRLLRLQRRNSAGPSPSIQPYGTFGPQCSLRSILGEWKFAADEIDRLIEIGAVVQNGWPFRVVYIQYWP